MKRFQDMVGKTYWHINPDGKKHLVLITSIENCNTIAKRKDWAWITQVSWSEYKQKMLSGCALNAVDLFSKDRIEFPCWDFELKEIK